MKTIFNTEGALFKTLADRGHRLTRPRRAVMLVLARAGRRLSPAQIHSRARALHPGTGLVTVYRTLEVLTDCGAVRKIHERSGCHTFALVSEGHAHHVICDRCHSVTEFDNCDLEALFRAVQRRTGYRVKDHWLELFGRCPECRRAEAGRQA